MVVRYRSRRGEVAPAEFYCYLEEGLSGSTAKLFLGFCSLLELEYFISNIYKYTKTTFFCRRYNYIVAAVGFTGA
jgi:hypothetical protein